MKNETVEFLKYMTTYVRKSGMLNHLNLSGLQLMNLASVDATDSYLFKSPE